MSAVAEVQVGDALAAWMRVKEAAENDLEAGYRASRVLGRHPSAWERAVPGHRKLAQRLLRPIPFVGTAVVLGTAGYALRRKGVVRGAAHIGLDIIPVVGTARAVVELFTGDLIPDKEAVNRLS